MRQLGGARINTRVNLSTKGLGGSIDLQALSRFSDYLAGRNDILGICGPRPTQSKSLQVSSVMMCNVKPQQKTYLSNVTTSLLNFVSKNQKINKEDLILMLSHMSNEQDIQ